MGRTLEHIRKEAATLAETITTYRKQLAIKEKQYAELVREAGEVAKAEIAGLAKGGKKKKKNPPGVIDTTFDDEVVNGANQ